MSFQDDIPSIHIDSFNYHYVPVFNLTSMQKPTKNYQFPVIVGKPLILELNFTFLLEHVTEHLLLGERLTSVAFDKFGVVGTKIPNRQLSLQQIISRIPLLNYPYLDSLLSKFVQTFPLDTSGIKNTQPSNLHWILTANSDHQLLFAEPFRGENYSFIKQQY